MRAGPGAADRGPMRRAASCRVVMAGLAVCGLGLLALAVPPAARSVPPAASPVPGLTVAPPPPPPRSRVSTGHHAVTATDRPSGRRDGRRDLVCPASTGRPILQAPGAGRTVALTFDDGPSAATPAVLRILAGEHVHATFFEIGQQVAADADLTRRVAAAGDLVENHSWSHRYPHQVPGGWSAAFLREDLRRTDEVLRATTGRQPCWFRPPGGFLTPSLAPAARAEQLGVALWSVDPRDWANQNPSRIAHAALTGLGQDHPIVLMHDGGGPRAGTVAALPTVISGYRQHGYRFVRLDGGA
jgi:peptidoglycan-N-acetylglucosamine deacetylase